MEWTNQISQFNFPCLYVASAFIVAVTNRLWLSPFLLLLLEIIYVYKAEERIHHMLFFILQRNAFASEPHRLSLESHICSRFDLTGWRIPSGIYIQTSVGGGCNSKLTSALLVLLRAMSSCAFAHFFFSNNLCLNQYSRMIKLFQI